MKEKKQQIMKDNPHTSIYMWNIFASPAVSNALKISL
jgi:hypothetical protein